VLFVGCLDRRALLGLGQAIDPTKTFVAMPGAIRQGCGNNS
jgi:hypothetical protein